MLRSRLIGFCIMTITAPAPRRVKCNACHLCCVHFHATTDIKIDKYVRQ